MSLWYRFFYAVGFTPWESDTAALAPQIDGLVALSESGREAPYGRALELGCGTGRWTVRLAQRGWDAVGVDVVPRALRAARQRAQKEGADVSFLEGNVTELRSAGVGSGFSLVLDVECFNHLSPAQRQEVGREVTAVTTADATLLLLVWVPGRRGPLPPGASRDDLVAAFPGWSIVDECPYEGEMPPPLRNVAPRWYRLARAA